MNKRNHDETPKTDRRPQKVSKPTIWDSPRVIAAGIIKNDKPVMNCSFENVTPISEEKKKKINTLVKLMDNLKAQIPAHEEFIEKCKSQAQDYTALVEEYQQVAKDAIAAKDKPIKVVDVEPCVPIIAADILNTFIKQKLKVEEPNTELEEELIILTQRNEKLMAANNYLAPEISKLLEDIDNQISRFSTFSSTFLRK